MKRSLIAAAVIAVIALLCLRLGYWIRQREEPESRYLSDELEVHAYAIVQMPVDYAIVQVHIEHADTNAVTAKRRCEQAVTALIAMAEPYGVLTNDIYGPPFSLANSYNRVEQDAGPDSARYKASREVFLRLRHISSFDDFLANICHLPSVSIQSIAYGCDDRDHYVQMALDEAMQNARKQAQGPLLSEGRTLGRAMETTASLKVDDYDGEQIIHDVFNTEPTSPRSFPAESIRVHAMVGVTFAVQPAKEK